MNANAQKHGGNPAVAGEGVVLDDAPVAANDDLSSSTGADDDLARSAAVTRIGEAVGDQIEAEELIDTVVNAVQIPKDDERCEKIRADLRVFFKDFGLLAMRLLSGIIRTNSRGFLQIEFSRFEETFGLINTLFRQGPVAKVSAFCRAVISREGDYREFLQASELFLHNDQFCKEDGKGGYTFKWAMLPTISSFSG